MQERQKMIDIYKKYGYNMPLKAKYKRDSNRIYFTNDFKDGEVVSFFWICDKPTACAEGYAFYSGDSNMSNLINIKELELINE